MKEKRYYIAYGSNLNVPQMRMRCPHATILGTANLKGWELLFKGSKTGSYLTIEECESGTVPVVIWEMDPVHIFPINGDKENAVISRHFSTFTVNLVQVKSSKNKGF